MIGWASAPYNPDWQSHHPRRAGWMALAGPAANFALFILSGLAIRLGILVGVFHAPISASFTHMTEASVPGAAGFAATFLSIFYVLNLLLGTFNLLPVPPLDGHNGILVFMSDAAAARYLSWSRAGFGMIGLLLAWFVYGKIFQYIFLFALNLLYPRSHYT